MNQINLKNLQNQEEPESLNSSYKFFIINGLISVTLRYNKKQRI